MVDVYSGWQQSFVSLGSLALDTLNPRLVGLNPNAHQSTVITSLMASVGAEIKEIAKSIHSHGFWPSETIIVVKSLNQKYAVVEGNCRVCAAKLLMNPELLADKRDKGYFDRLRKTLPNTHLESLKRINCAIAPDRDVVDPLLTMRHVGNPTNSWSVYAQGQFIRRKLDEGLTREEINAFPGIERTTYDRSLITHEIINLALKQDWSDEVSGFFETHVDSLSRDFAGIIRFITSKSAELELNYALTLTPYGSVKYHTTSGPDFFQLLEVLVHMAFVEKLIDTRTTNSLAGVQQIAALVKKKLTRRKAVGGDFDSQDYFDDKELKEHLEKEKERKKREAQGRRKRDNDKKLINKNQKFLCNDSKLLDLLNESTKLDWKEHCYASSLMMRAMLELAIKSAMKSQGVWKDFELSQKEKYNRPIGIEELLDYIKNNREVWQSDEDFRTFKEHVNDIRAFVKKRLNFVQHSTSDRIVDDDVKLFRSRIIPVVLHFSSLVR